LILNLFFIFFEGIPASDLCGVMYADGRGNSNDKGHIKVKIYN
jgi:hypothetical protein